MHSIGGRGGGARFSREAERIRMQYDKEGGTRHEYPFWPTLWKYVQPYRTSIYRSSLLAFLSGLGVAFQPIIVKFVVDEGITRPGASVVVRMKWALAFIGVYVVLSIIRTGAWTLGYRMLVRALEGFLFTIRSKFFRHVQTLCFRFHDQVSSGELFNYIMGSPIQSLRMFLNQFTMMVPNQLVSWIIVLATLAYFDWLMTCITLVTIVVIIIINRRSRRIIRTMSAQFMQEESSVSKYVADMLRGSREIKIQAMERDVSNRFDIQIGRIRSQGEDLAKRQQFERIKPEFIHYMGIACIYIAGAYSCIYRDMTIGKLFAFLSSVNMLMHPVMMLLQLNLIKANAEAGLERIMRILETETSIQEKPPEIQLSLVEQDKVARAQNVPFIEFRTVSFTYHKNQVLNNLSCRIEHGQSIALVGPSGSGKTTFARLLLRLYDNQQGQIIVNGHDIRLYSLQELRSNFGVVSQDPFLFQTTVFENIRVAHPEASKEDVLRAMDMAYITEFIPQLPNGKCTEVGEAGFGLSGGQRQRIAIARAILGNPRYYIFDEATSALDNQSERRIQEAMGELGQTHSLIIIAHRLSTIRNVDKILVFDKGSIVQEGTYKQLAHTPGMFGDLLKNGE